MAGSALTRLLALGAAGAWAAAVAPAAPAEAAHVDPARWRGFGEDSGCGREVISAKARSQRQGQQVASLSDCRSLCEGLPTGMCTGVEYSHVTSSCFFLREKVQFMRHAPGKTCWSLAPEDDTHHTEVFVMLPLDTVSDSGELKDPHELAQMLDKLKWAGLDGFMVDVWWGLTEKSPKVYNFSAYRDLFEMARERQWQVQAVASFHQCGGNVGDSCNILLPDFVLKADDIWYRDSYGNDDREYISLFADEVPVGGRTPVQMYQDWMAAFASEFSHDLGGLISEVMVGMGPCGELRYPSYRLDHWSWCGHGEFQSWDHNALASLHGAAQSAGHLDWAFPPTVAEAGHYKSRPNETEFFGSGFKTDQGKFFLDWYSNALQAHGHRVLSRAREVFQGKTGISGKVAGIHWWYDSPSHAAEATAGYYNTNGRNGYHEIAGVFKEHGASLDFTCLEMRTADASIACLSNPEGLITQVIEATQSHGMHFGGENALQRYDTAAYEQMISYKEHLKGLTYLRLTPELVEPDNLERFKDFTTVMHGVGHQEAQSVDDINEMIG
mmetsp:Transcript_160610/g.510916  ORF Transcript_160610/g.510916 Transcript_160610/m.510916 type:complete len:554 (+) Transcript_160610:99-1760(+)